MTALALTDLNIEINHVRGRTESSPYSVLGRVMPAGTSSKQTQVPDAFVRAVDAEGEG